MPRSEVPEEFLRNVHASMEGLASPSPSLYRGRDAGTLAAVPFNEIPDPGPRAYLLDGLIPEGAPTIVHGEGGVAKSMLALSFGLAVACGGTWLGRDVGEAGAVLFLDFELDDAEQRRRINRLARGDCLEEIPDGMFYMSALGAGPREALKAALGECEQRGVKLMILDSMGMALGGDAEASRDIIGFFSEVMEPFRAAGVTVLVIDHQSRQQAGEKYQNKGAFGSVYKENLSRSRIQVEASERGKGTLTIRLRHKKHNFGTLAKPFGARLTFTEEAVTLDTVELTEADLAEEGTLNALDQVRHALADGPAYAGEISEATGLAEKTVKNKLTELRKAGEVEGTREFNNRSEQVKLASPPPYPLRDGDGDARHSSFAGRDYEDDDAF